jgi:hypothetical protein
MGLDFSHCDAHWAYSGFMRFREKLAFEIGVAIHCMEGFASSLSGKYYDTVKVCGHNEDVGLPGYDDYISLQKVIPWDKVNDDIVPLLNHSDCEGILTPEECRKVAPRLRELVAGWTSDDHDKRKALLLAKGMEEAAELNENFEFF